MQKKESIKMENIYCAISCRYISPFPNDGSIGSSFFSPSFEYISHIDMTMEWEVKDS